MPTTTPFTSLPKTSSGKSYLWLKMSAFLILLAAASFAFGHACSLFYAKYLTILMLGPELKELGIWLFVSFVLIIISSGLVAVFVRPLWLASFGFLISALIAVFYIGVTPVTLFGGLFYVVLGYGYVQTVKNNMKNQIKFSPDPLFSAYKIILLAFSFFICAGFALGYTNDASKNNFIFPPAVKNLASNTIIAQVKDEAVKKAQLGEPEIAAGIEKAKEQTDKMWSDLETALEPAKPYLPLIMGISLFMLIQPLLMLTSGIPLIILAGIFPLLKLMRVIHLTVETAQVSRYSLEP